MANTYNPIEESWNEEPSIRAVPLERVFVFPIERFIELEVAVNDLRNIKAHIWAGVISVSAVTLSVVAIVYQSMQTTMEVAKSSQPVVQAAPPPVIINNVLPPEKRR